jgi:hypothetical protein
MKIKDTSDGEKGLFLKLLEVCISGEIKSMYTSIRELKQKREYHENIRSIIMQKLIHKAL